MAKDYAKNSRVRNRAMKSDRSQNSIPGWFWFFAGIFIGILVVGIFYLKTLKHNNIQSASVFNNQPTKPHQTKHEHNKPAEQHNQPRFDFYTMLPKMKVGANNEMGQSKENNNHTEENYQDKLKNIDPAQSALNRFDKDDEELSTQSQENNQQVSTSVGQQAPQSNANQEQANSIEGKEQSSLNSANAYIVLVKQLQTTKSADKVKAQLSLAGYDVKMEPINLADETLNRILLGPFKTKEEAEQARKMLLDNHLTGQIQPLKIK